MNRPPPVLETKLQGASAYGSDADRFVAFWRALERLEVDQRVALRARGQRTRAGGALERVDDPEFLRDLTQCRNHFLAQEADTRHPLLERERPLRLEKSQNSRVQHFHDEAQLRDDALRRADDDLQTVLRFLVVRVDLLLRFLDGDLATAQPFTRVALAATVRSRLIQCFARDPEEAVIACLAGEPAGCFLRVVARRQSPFGTREVLR